MISVKNLVKKYGDTEAVKNISFEVGKGEIVGFLGPNGAGKTTTLRMLSGCLPPSSGLLEVAGHQVTAGDVEVRKRVGYLPENNPLYPEMDGAEYLDWIAEVRGFHGLEKTKRIRSAAEACGLHGVLAKPIGLLSKGYRQRVGLAAAILHDPDVLLFDEPTSGLDPNQSREVRELILRLKQSKTVLVSTHILPEVEAFCDRAIIIHKGEIAASGTTKELIKGASAGTALQVSIRAAGVDESAALHIMREVDGIKHAEVSRVDGEFHFRLVAGENMAGDLREKVFRLAVSKDWTLLRLNQEEATLEHVFRGLTLS